MQPTAPLQRALRRLALTTKQANKGFYKGTGTGSMGWHTKHGGYKLDYRKVRTYVYPYSMENFTLTPFVTRRLEKPTRGGQFGSAGPMDGQRYLDKWKSEGGKF